MAPRDEYDPKWDPGEVSNQHVRAVGEVVMAWNWAQAELTTVYAKLVSPENEPIARATWHAIKADRSQREMLKAAGLAVEAKLGEKWTRLKKILDRMDSLEDDRNNIVHAPVEAVVTDKGLQVAADTKTGSPRAIKLELKGKDILQFAAATAARINDLAIEINRLDRDLRKG
jgi:hypothetical protein